MNEETIVECSFFIPIRRDANLSDGQPHSTEMWATLNFELFARFEGGTQSPGLFQGCYRDPDTGERVDDESAQFIVATVESRVEEVRKLLVEACDWFFQKCIYLSVAGKVEFVKKP